MRVALVQCPPWGSLPPLGLAALKAYLDLHGHEVSCFDLNIDYVRERRQEMLSDVGGSVYARPDPFASESFGEWDYDFDGEVQFKSDLRQRPLPVDRWAEEVLDGGPQVVGFSVQATNLGVTLQVAQEIVRRDPAVRVVFGGPNVAKAQQGGRALATGVPAVVVEGEGEETFVALLDAFASGQDLGEVLGIGRLVEGRPRWNENRPLLADVNAIPFPDFSDFDWTIYPNPYEIPVMGSRGCVLNCAFCYETVYWKRYRTQSARRIVEEIEHQIAAHPLRREVESGVGRFSVAFADSLVNGHLGGLRRMSEMLAESDADVSWTGQATINTKMDDEFFAKLRSSGCEVLAFGLESGSQHVLESMGKRFQIDEASAFLERVHRSGIRVIVNVMVGFPTESWKDFGETLRFLTRIRRYIYIVNNVSPTGVPGGSRIHTAPEEFGVTPVNLAGWSAGEDFEWESAATGTERDRERRLILLHAWMTLWRIPHQPAASIARLRERVLQPLGRGASPEAVPWAPPSTMAREDIDEKVEELTRTIGEEPVLAVATRGAFDQVVGAPAWAAPLLPDTWAGVAFEDLGSQLALRLGADLVRTVERQPEGYLEVHLEVIAPRSEELVGLRLFVFTVGGEGTQILAFFRWQPSRPGLQSVAGRFARRVHLRSHRAGDRPGAH